jgi:hypothetical protein
MSRNPRKNRCSASVHVEALDARTLLSGSAVATPAPASGPVSVAAINRLENRIHKLEQQFMSRAQKLHSQMAGQTKRLETLLNHDRQSLASALAASNAAAQVKLAQASTKFTAEFNRDANRIASQTAALSTSLQNKMTSLAARAIGMNPQLSTAAAGLLGSAGMAGSQLVIDTVNGLSAASRSFQLGFKAVSGAITSPGNFGNSSFFSVTATAPTRTVTGATARTTSAATTTTGTTTIGFVNSATQVFNNAFTQAFAAFNAAISGVASALQTAFRSFTTQLSTATTATGTIGFVPSQTQVFNNVFTQAFSPINSTINGISSTLGSQFSSVTGFGTIPTPTGLIGVTTIPTVTPGFSPTTTTPIGITTVTPTGGSLVSTATGTGTGINNGSL